MDNEELKQLETMHNVYIDIETMQYNHDSYDAIFGWLEIPEEWLEEIGFFE